MRYCILILLLISFDSFGQAIDNTKLFIEGSEVVCEFNNSDLITGTKNMNSKLYEFRTFELQKIISENKFSTWSKKDWKLYKIGGDKYQLRKNLKDFNDNFPPHFKYLIDDKRWEGPLSEPIVKINDLKDNVTPRKKTYSINENGNTSFQLKEFTNAKQVILSGSFNNWNEQEIKMKKINNIWTVTLELEPGIYEYKFIPDGEWTHDVRNPYTVVNQHQTLNSILLVGSKVVFKLDSHTDAKKVILAGSFNNWNEKAASLSKTATGWHITVTLPPGKHFYKFIVDGQWILDPINKLQQRDKEGHVNSVKLIH